MAKTERDKASEDMMHFIRVMRCLETTGLAFVGICFTCDRRFHIGYLDAGHFISGRRNAVLFDIMCIRLQCNYCNVTMHSQPKIYKAKMITLYGCDLTYTTIAYPRDKVAWRFIKSLLLSDWYMKLY
ncbi:hypothetical protein LCGC14_1276010, partial [marine sediment metagenome]